MNSLIEKLEAERSKIASRTDLADTATVKAALVAIDGCIEIVRKHSDSAADDIARIYQIAYAHGINKSPPLTPHQVLEWLEMMKEREDGGSYQ